MYSHLLSHDNARPYVPILPWPAYSAISTIEHVWDALDRQCVPVPINIQQLHSLKRSQLDRILLY
uniref:Tc1-like transposase DDE domain-containing protein n=1 Tax=Oncorhynchus kisutch TaxID=8019 RepID=A0A8C7JF22_ONCKI